MANRKKTERLYREEGLSVKRRRGYKKASGTRAPILVEAVPSAHWWVNFVHDQLTSGRRLRILNVIDDVTKECMTAVVDTSISGRRVARALSDLIAIRGSPGVIFSDHGTEFTSNAMLEWTQKTACPCTSSRLESRCRKGSAKHSTAEAELWRQAAEEALPEAI